MGRHASGPSCNNAACHPSPRPGSPAQGRRRSGGRGCERRAVIVGGIGRSNSVGLGARSDGGVTALGRRDAILATWAGGRSGRLEVIDELLGAPAGDPHHARVDSSTVVGDDEDLLLGAFSARLSRELGDVSPTGCDASADQVPGDDVVFADIDSSPRPTKEKCDARPRDGESPEAASQRDVRRDRGCDTEPERSDAQDQVCPPEPPRGSNGERLGVAHGGGSSRSCGPCGHGG